MWDKMVVKIYGVDAVAWRSRARFCVKTSFLAMVAIGMSVYDVRAQTAPSRVVPETTIPKVERNEAGIVLPQTRLSAAPTGAEALSVRIDRVEIGGGKAEFAQSTNQLTSAVQGKTVTIAELYGIAARIEALYASNGYILTRAVVPPQNLQDGAIFKIEIVSGFIESVDTSAAPARVAGILARQLAPLVGRQGLTLSEIERHVLLAGRVPGIGLATTLMAGDQIGGARLVVQSTHKVASLSVGTDNPLSGAYDSWSVDARVAINAALGHGEQFFGLVTTATDFQLAGGQPLRRIVGAGASIPIGIDGLSVTGELLRADTNPKTPIGGVPITGVYDRAALTLRYPLILTRRETLSLSGVLEGVNEHQSVTGFGVRLSEDRLRIVTLGLDWSKATSVNSSIAVTGQIAQGIDGLGARNQADALATGILLSRQGSKPDFAKVAASFIGERSFENGVRARGVVRAQASLSGALPSASQFALDGAEGLSGFALGSISVDSGVTARFEVSRQYNVSTDVRLLPYVFAAAGAGSIDQPTVLERKNPDGYSAGLGVRAGLTRNVYLNSEAAQSRSNINDKDETRLSVSVGVQF
jgi:hemolysin activation/secretion protein